MVSMIAGGLFNAAAFAGAGFLFKHLDKDDYSKEIERHNRATEDLSRAKEAWYEKEVGRKNKIEEKRRELDNANADINSTNKALDRLNKVLERQIVYLESSGVPEPELSEFYEPSDEMKEYEELAITILGTLGGYLWYKLYKRARR